MTVNELRDVRPKKLVLFPGIGQVKIFSSITHPRGQMCIRIYIFNFNNKKKKKTKKENAKETKQKKRISVEHLKRI